MKVIGLFTIVDKTLLTVQYSTEAKDEFTTIFEKWLDPIYLESFFEENQTDLNSGFYPKTSVEEAINATIDEAFELEAYIRTVANNSSHQEGNSLYDLVFKKLSKNDYSYELVKSKSYGPAKQSWLRLYAIEINTNLYIITGGAIKLKKKMDRPHLVKELHKLETTKEFLIENELIEESDF